MSRLSRRTFLRRVATGLGAATVAPQIVRDTATGAAPDLASPSERVSCAIIGCGNRGPQVMGHFLRQPDVQWIACCDCRQDRLDRAKKQVDRHYGHTDCATYRDFRELLARPDLDGVLIATGNRWHALGAIYAARAGKDVYSEKPISLTLAEGRALVETCNRLGTIYQAGYQRHSVDSFRFAIECVHQKRIGDLKEIICHSWTNSVVKPSPAIPVPEGFGYDMWLGSTPWHPFSWARVNGWRVVWDTGAGILADMGCHWTDLAQWANQAEETGPTTIEVHEVQWAPRESLTEVPIAARAVTTYANGVRVVHDATGTFNGRYIRFVGTDGWVQVHDATNSVTAEPASLLRWRAISAKGWGDPGDHIRNFLHGIKTRQRTVCYPEAAHRAMSLCQLANIGIRLGRTLRWDPVKEEFPDDAEANTMRSRAMRPPWRI